jgi:hypothetical protein
MFTLQTTLPKPNKHIKWAPARFLVGIARHKARYLQTAKPKCQNRTFRFFPKLSVSNRKFRFISTENYYFLIIIFGLKITKTFGFKTEIFDETEHLKTENFG